MDIEDAGRHLASDDPRALLHQLTRLQEIVESLTTTFEELALDAGTEEDCAAKAVARTVLSKAMQR